MRGTRKLCALPPDGADVSGTPTVIYAGDTDLELFVAYTLGDSNVWLAFGNHTPVIGDGLVLLANGGSKIELDRDRMFTDQIVGITESGAVQRVHFQPFK